MKRLTLALLLVINTAQAGTWCIPAGSSYICSGDDGSSQLVLPNNAGGVNIYDSGSEDRESDTIQVYPNPGGGFRVYGRDRSDIMPPQPVDPYGYLQ